MPKTPIDIQRHTAEEAIHPSGIEIFSFDILYRHEVAKQMIFTDHRSSFYHIFRCSPYCKNTCTHYVEDKEVVFNNSLLFINRDISHKYPMQMCDGFIVLFTDTFFASTYEKIDFLSHNTTLFKNDYTLIPMQSAQCTTIVDLYLTLMKQRQPQDKTETANTIILRNLLHNLLMTIERECRARIPRISSLQDDEYYMQQFKTLLDEHYQTHKQVSFYATELRISEKRLSQIVYAKRGMSAKAFINEKMLTTAIFLLQNTTLNQAEIAQKLGLDAIYFLKFFSKHTGMTPARYRQQQEEETTSISAT